MMIDYSIDAHKTSTFFDSQTKSVLTSQDGKLKTEVTAIDNIYDVSTSIQHVESYLKSFDDIKKNMLYLLIIKQLKKDDPTEDSLASNNLINTAYKDNSQNLIFIIEEMFKCESTSILESLLKSIIFSEIFIFQDWFKNILSNLSSSDNRILKFKADSLRLLYKDYFLST